MSRIETVYAVSDPQATVEKAVSQLVARLDENIRGIQNVFERNGDQLWNAEPASHTVTPVVVRERRHAGLVGHEDVLVTHYVAPATGERTVMPRRSDLPCPRPGAIFPAPP
jgi:hypothetical protein